MEKHSKLEEELKLLTDKLGEAEELSSVRYQRCEELQASTEKYHSQKIGTFYSWIINMNDL